MGSSSKEHESNVAVWLKTGAYFYLFFVIGLVQGIIGSSLLFLQQHTHVTEASIGTVVIARSVGWLIGSVFAGFLLKRIDIHRMLVGALLVMITAHLLVPFLASFFALWALFLAIGVSGGLLEAGGNSVLIMTWREKVGPFLQFLNFAIGIGALLSPLIMAVLLTEESVEFSVIASFVSLAGLMIPPVFVLGSFRSPSFAVVEEGKDELEDGSSPRSVSMLVCMCLFTLAISGIEISSSSYLPMFTKDVFDWPPAKCDMTVSVFYGLFTLSRLIMSFRFPCLSPQKIFFALIVLLLGGVGLLVFAQVSVAGISMFFAVASVGFGLGPLFAMSMSLPIESPSKYLLNPYDVALIVASSNVGELGTPSAVSLLWSTLGAKAFLVTTIAMTVGTVACGIWLVVLAFIGKE